MSRERTILDDLDLLQSGLAEIYTTILSDEHVKQANYSLLYPQTKLFFLLFKQGVEYSYKAYGEDSIASGLRLYSQFTNKPNHLIVTDYIGYDPDADQIQLTLFHLAGQCAYYNSSVFFTDSHLPNVRIGAEAYTVLQAIEESYHRYQIHHLKYDLVPTAESMRYEQEITPVWQKALSDLKLQFVADYD